MRTLTSRIGEIIEEFLAHSPLFSVSCLWMITYGACSRWTCCRKLPTVTRMSRVTEARYRVLMDADAQRASLGLTYRDIVRMGLEISERSIGAWMRGESWPQGANQKKLEHAVGWPGGEMRRRELRYKQMPNRAMRWVTDTTYRLRLANRMLRAGVTPEARPGGIDSEYVEAALEADPTVPFDMVAAIFDGIGVDIAELDADATRRS